MPGDNIINATLTDGANCFEIIEHTINVNAAPVVSIEIIEQLNCNEDTGILQASVPGGVSTYDYAWSHGTTDPIASNVTAERIRCR